MINEQQFRERYELIVGSLQTLVDEHSSLQYIQESMSIVDGGAFQWSALPPDSKRMQLSISKEYQELTQAVRLVLEENECECLEEFDLSCQAVLDFIMQRNICLESQTEDALIVVKMEINQQQHFFREFAM
ncbi:hypothetical protein J2Z69_000621 [Paenibacillus shirakamiensis]|uniref:Uncharacterized protein n=1 Tax=Paenibacillus shirakamiensis TaxID=1265935 RepID=A0ABS4JD01_9BACL|nr:hypothetical protein [Paenibacillus shirakamiensis]MBP1999602.1 hypothetical protein [Paenibacillus shirakamiensis]